MLRFILGCIVAGLPLICVEVFSRLLKLNGELTRKSTHVLSSLAVVSLTLFCSLNQIAMIALVFFVFLLSIRHKKIWHSLYHVKRDTWGEILFPVGVLAAALIANTPHNFVTAMLLLGLSDTAASLVGQRFGKKHLTLVKHKTYTGSLACLFVSLCILIIWSGGPLLLLAVVALTVTLAEAIASKGLDNVLIPITALAMISLLHL